MKDEGKQERSYSVYRDSEFRLSINDDGQGFSISKSTDNEESGRGRGLFSRMERIMLLGGTGSIKSVSGQGTTVWARVPRSQPDEDE